ncbi:uncharacterized protein LOC141897374 [Acropora palmata]|uniref:uncharacterized protein LOC141897374 n=1 Tax=Acropora palmata TaxID=6131 RepID=UPI003DA0C967
MPNNLKALSTHETIVQMKIPLGTLQFASNSSAGFFAVVDGLHDNSSSESSEKKAASLVNQGNMEEIQTTLFTSPADEIGRDKNIKLAKDTQFCLNLRSKVAASETQLKTERKQDDLVKGIPCSTFQSGLTQISQLEELNNNTDVNTQHEIFETQNTAIDKQRCDPTVIQTDDTQVTVTIQRPHFKVLFCIGRKGESVGQFEEPVGVAFNTQGEIVVADFNNDRLQVISQDGEVVQVHDSYSRESGKRFAFFSPAGVACDSNGNIAVVEKARNRVVVVSPGGKILRTFGRHGTDPAQFRGPHGVCIDARNRIIVTDTINSRVQIFDCEGNFLLSFGNKGQHKLNYPSYAIFHAGRFYVADTDNDCVKVFDTRGMFLRKFGDGLNAPSGIAIYKDKFLLVCDYSNDSLKVFSLDGRILTNIGTSGKGSNNFFGPEAVAVCTTEGKIVVTDKLNCRLQVLDLISN